MVEPHSDSPSYHWVVIGASKYAQYTSQCLESSATKTIRLKRVGSSWSNDGLRDIAVSCCKQDGSSGARPGCKKAKSYDEALQICSAEGMRLCTRAEMEADKTKGKGCGFDGYSNWVSDTCPGTVTFHFHTSFDDLLYAVLSQ